MATANTAAKTARAPRKAAARKAVSGSQTAGKAPVVTPVDPDVYVAPTGRTDGFVSNGTGPALDRLTDRGRANLIELATDKVTPESEGNTPQARAYWTRRLSQYGISV